jgi:hypothetical protein
MLVYHRAFKPRFGFGALGSNELQLSSMLFAVYQCALSVDIADPDDGESSGLKRFRKAGSQAPADIGSRGLSLHRRGNAGCENARNTCIFDDETTVHKKLLNSYKRCILRDRQPKVLVLTREKTGVYP